MRKQEDWKHEYKATPIVYPIEDNDRPATYNQFITLRDTLVMSNKYYADNAGRSLIIGVKTDGTPTDTIEIWKPNMVRQGFEPTWVTVPVVLGSYVSTWWHSSTNALSCEINKDGRYKLVHKEQFKNIDPDITRILAYILQHHADWSADTERAVFDWERTTAWEFKKITSFGYVECDLKKWDWLELKILDQNGNDIPLTELQANSNWWNVEYIDLIYNA